MTLCITASAGVVLCACVLLSAINKLRRMQRKYGRQAGDYLIYWGDREQSRFTD
jgi:hypothetical protein